MITSDTLQTKYHFDKIQAGYIFGIPYIISACLSPLMGFTIDKIGKRAFMIIISSVILIISFTASMLAPECDKCYNEVFPLILIGIGYSLYASAIWSSIPYVVEPSATGTAFGITTAIQNIGMVIAPTLVGYIKDKTISHDYGFFYVHAFFLVINIFGFLLGCSLYYIDIVDNNRVLDRVNSAEDLKEKLMTPRIPT